MDIVGRFTGQLFWLNLCDQLERDPIMDDSPPPYRQRMSSVEGARQLVQWYGADVTHQLLEVEEIKKIWDPQSKHFLPFSKSYFGRWDFIMASATLQVMHDKKQPSLDNLEDFHTTIPDRQIMRHRRHASCVGFFLVFSDSLCCQLTFFATDWQWVLSARDKNGRWVKKAVKLPTTKVKKAVKSTFAAFGNELWAAACLRLLNSLTPF